jgi:hypothetical protein
MPSLCQDFSGVGAFGDDLLRLLEPISCLSTDTGKQRRAASTQSVCEWPARTLTALSIGPAAPVGRHGRIAHRAGARSLNRWRRVGVCVSVRELAVNGIHEQPRGG